jgi:hypothetical protein
MANSAAATVMAELRKKLIARLDAAQNRRILVPEPALGKLLQLGTVGEFWRTSLTDHPTQKGLKPV